MKILNKMTKDDIVTPQWVGEMLCVGLKTAVKYMEEMKGSKDSVTVRDYEAFINKYRELPKHYSLPKAVPFTVNEEMMCHKTSALTNTAFILNMGQNDATKRFVRMKFDLPIIRINYTVIRVLHEDLASFIYEVIKYNSTCYLKYDTQKTIADIIDGNIGLYDAKVKIFKDNGIGAMIATKRLPSFWQPRASQSSSADAPEFPVDTNGVRDNGGKPTFQYIDPALMLEVANIFAIGVKKYPNTHFSKEGMVMTLRTGADSLLRHFYKFMSGEDTDEEDGTHHIAKIVACAVIMWHNRKQGDNRKQDIEFRGFLK